MASSLIQCHFDYACSAWYGGLRKLYQQKLQILQNKTIRFVLDRPSRSHVGIAKFKVPNLISVSGCAKQINLCIKYTAWYMGRRPSILKWNCSWLVSGIPSLSGTVCTDTLPYLTTCEIIWGQIISLFGHQNVECSSSQP